MALSPWVGWSISTLALWVLNRGSSESDEDPAELSVTETSLGNAIPAVLGRAMIKSPICIYFGDFEAKKYTEAYAAHSSFSAWPVLLTMLLEWALQPKTGDSVDSVTNGHIKDKHTHPQLNVVGEAHLVGQNVPSGPHSHDIKETKGPNYLMALATWLLGWLINQRNLHTTVQKGFKYYLGYQQLLCWSGPNMRIRAIWMEKYDSSTRQSEEGAIWSGDESAKDHQTSCAVIHIDDDELFGGADEGGGFVGDVRVYLGSKTQPCDPWMVQQMSANTIQEELRGLTPAYRPFVTAVIPKAYIGKSATIPTMWYEMQNIPDALGLGAIEDDCNPAEMIYEIYCNKDWGLGREQLPDTDSLIAMGNTLKNEGIGLTCVLSQKQEANAVIDSILSHIDGVRFQNPATGKTKFKLIRSDYDLAELPQLNMSNCSAIEYNRLDWRETVGEIVVTYTDRGSKYEQATVSDNDPSVIEMSDNYVKSQDISYLYFTTAKNALWAARREQLQQGYPLASGTITCDRHAFMLRQGDVACLNWDAYGIKNMAIRITNIDLGDLVGGQIQIDFIEDVFGLGSTEFNYSGSTNWKTEDKYPTGAQDFKYMEMPYEIIPDKDTYVNAFCAKPSSVTARWDIWRNKNGVGWTKTNGKTEWTPTGSLVYDLDEFTADIIPDGIEVRNIYGLEDLTSATLDTGEQDLNGARNGDRIISIGDELMAWSCIEVLPNGNFLIKGVIRGVFDTIPEKHGSTDVLFFMKAQTYANVTTGGPVCTKGLTTPEQYNITTVSETGVVEDFDVKKVTDLTTVRRAERPSAPGNVKMSYMGKDFVRHYDEVVGSIDLSWTDRDKVLCGVGVVSQGDVTNYYTGKEFELPLNASYQIDIRVNNVTVKQYSIGVDKAFTYTWGMRCKDCSDLNSQTEITIFTVLDGLKSYQPQKRLITWDIPTVINGCVDEIDLKNKLTSWYGDTLISVPDGLYNNLYQLNYSKFPVIIFGTLGTSADNEKAYFTQDGQYIIPNGKIAYITGRGTYILADLDDGYVFDSIYKPEGIGAGRTYTYSGGVLTYANK